MAGDRIEALRGMLAKKPDDTRLLFGLALELEKQQHWTEVVDVLSQYLAQTDDEGNAWGRLGNALRLCGRDAEARAAYDRGIAAARAHGHPSMAADFEEILGDWD